MLGAPLVQREKQNKPCMRGTILPYFNECLSTLFFVIRALFSMADLSSPFLRALASVEGFSSQAVAVMPESPTAEMLRYIAHVTGEDEEKLQRLYQMFITTGRLDQLGSTGLPPVAGFAEEP